MRRCLPVVALLALTGGGLAPAPVEAAGDGFKTYVACGQRASAKPSRSCELSDNPTAFFTSSKRGVTYKVCVRFPDKKERLCASAQDAPKGEKRRVTITTGSLGKHKVSWYVDGRKVGGWKFRVVAG